MKACLQGLSSELGAFVAGVMLSTTEQQEFTLHQIESLKGFFLSLFICSTGLVMSPVFLLQHMRILAGGVLLTVASKTLLVPAPQLWPLPCVQQLRKRTLSSRTGCLTACTAVLRTLALWLEAPHPPACARCTVVAQPFAADSVACLSADQRSGAAVQLPSPHCAGRGAGHGPDRGVCLCAAVGSQLAGHAAVPGLHAPHGCGLLIGYDSSAAWCWSMSLAGSETELFSNAIEAQLVAWLSKVCAQASQRCRCC